jgi:signal transduction histidine kinase
MIADTGIGIARIRCSSWAGRSVGRAACKNHGSGLGLAIARSLTNARLDAAALETGTGTVVCVSLPRRSKAERRFGHGLTRIFG